MKDTGHRDLPERDLPEGWDPAADHDAQWESMVELIREADQPDRVPPARFEAMRLELARTLREEGLIRDNAKARGQHAEGFGAWLATVLFGGGQGGQVVRLGVVAAVALIVGLRFSGDTDTTEQRFMADSDSTPSEPAMVAQIPQDRLPTTSGDILASPGTLAQQGTPVTAAGSEPGIIRHIQGPRIPVAGPGTVNGGGMSLTRSHVAELEQESLWSETVPNAQAWLFEAPRTAMNAGRGAFHPVTQGTYGDPRARMASEALDQLQVLKFYSLVNQDEQSLREVRRIESMLADLVAQTEWNSQPKASVLDAFRKAEAALAARRYHQAQQAFEEITFLAPGSSHAFIAHFQIGRIAMDNTQDYGLALDSFRRCLGEFPSSMMSSEHRRYLMDRVMVLTETETEGWQSLSWWQASQQAQDPREAARLLERVVVESTSDRLASDAATRLKDVVLADVALQRIGATELAESIRDRVARTSSGHDAGRIQYAVAEMIARGSTNAREAEREYQRVLDLPSDEQTRRLAANRLTQLRLLGEQE